MKHWNLDYQGESPAVGLSTDSPLPPAQPDATGTCDLYGPGHQIHYKHQAQAAASPALVVRDTMLEGTRLTLVLSDGDELTWSNHDPRRLGRILDLVQGQGAVYPQFHALRIGPYWFNCATESDSWQDCRLSQAAARE